MAQYVCTISIKSLGSIGSFSCFTIFCLEHSIVWSWMNLSFISLVRFDLVLQRPNCTRISVSYAFEPCKHVFEHVTIFQIFVTQGEIRAPLSLLIFVQFFYSSLVIHIQIAALGWLKSNGNYSGIRNKIDCLELASGLALSTFAAPHLSRTWLLLGPWHLGNFCALQWADRLRRHTCIVDVKLLPR